MNFLRIYFLPFRGNENKRFVENNPGWMQIAEYIDSKAWLLESLIFRHSSSEKFRFPHLKNGEIIIVSNITTAKMINIVNYS